MCGWAARANRQSRTNKPQQPPKPEPERPEKPLPRGFAQLGGRRAIPKGLVVVKPVDQGNRDVPGGLGGLVVVTPPESDATP